MQFQENLSKYLMRIISYANKDENIRFVQLANLAVFNFSVCINSYTWPLKTLWKWEHFQIYLKVTVHLNDLISYLK